MSENNLLVTLADKNYLEFAKQLFSSAYFNSGWQGDYMLLAHDISEKDLTWFTDRGILIKHCQPLTNKMFGRWPVTLTSKFYLFSSEFKRWNKIIYLDADLIITSSLDNLLDVTAGIKAIKNKDHFFLRQIRLKHFLDYYRLAKEKKEIILDKYSPNLPMYCGGVMAFDTKIIEDKTFAELTSLALRYKDDIGSGEFALSLIFANKWQAISPNYCLHFNYLKDYNFVPLKAKTVTAHFIYYKKPYDYCPELYSIWKKNLEMADNINLSKRLPAKIHWTEKELVMDFWKLKFKIITFIWIKLAIERVIGLIGLALKEVSPFLYQKLKKNTFLTKKLEEQKNNFSKPNYFIRDYQPEDDQGLFNSNRLIFGHIDEKRWLWKYKQPPIKPIILVAENDKKIIVGHFSAWCQKIKLYDSERVAHQIIDAGIEPEYRHQGFLEKGFKVLIERENFLPWGFVSEKLTPRYELSIPSAGAKQKNKQITYNILEKKLVEKDIDENSYSIEEINLLNGSETLDKLWENKKTEIKVGVIRDWEYLKWRVMDTPDNISLFIIKDGKKCIGYFVLGRLNDLAVLDDLLILNDYLSKPLWQIIENFLIENKYKKNKILVTDKKLYDFLISLDYQLGEEYYFVYNDSTDRIKEGDFYLTLIDTDWIIHN